MLNDKLRRPAAARRYKTARFARHGTVCRSQRPPPLSLRSLPGWQLLGPKSQRYFSALSAVSRPHIPIWACPATRECGPRSPSLFSVKSASFLELSIAWNVNHSHAHFLTTVRALRGDWKHRAALGCFWLFSSMFSKHSSTEVAMGFQHWTRSVFTNAGKCWSAATCTLSVLSSSLTVLPTADVTTTREDLVSF